MNKTFIASSPKNGNTEPILFNESDSVTSENGYSSEYDFDIMNTDNGCEDTLIAISRWEIAYIVDQDQNVGFNRPLRSGFHWNDLYLWIRNREPVKDQQANVD